MIGAALFLVAIAVGIFAVGAGGVSGEMGYAQGKPGNHFFWIGCALVVFEAWLAYGAGRLS